MPGCGPTNVTFYFNIVTEETFSKKEEFILCVYRFGERFW